MTTDLLPLSPDQGRPVAPVEAIIADIRQQLAEARSLVELEALSRRAAAVADLARRARAADQVRIDAAELTLDCYRAVGVEMKRAPKHVGGRPGKTGSAANPVSAPTTLAELGISKSLAAVYRAIGAPSDAGYRDLKARGRAMVDAHGVAALGELAPRRVARLARDEARRRAGNAPEFRPYIKPSDSWNFSQPLAFPKLDDGSADDAHGYIPGELYASLLHYFTRPGELVLAPMAGSGLILEVYRRRAEWMAPEPWGLDIRAYDLFPRGPHRALISRHDILDGLPELPRPPDYVVMDPPYYGIARGQYGDDPGNLATMDWPVYRGAFARLAQHCADGQRPGGRVSFVSPNFSDVKTGAYIPVAHELTKLFEAAGYRVVGLAYSTRRIQQKQGHDMAVKNNLARRSRVMLTDISTVATLRRV